jgi:hypothetical protein
MLQQFKRGDCLVTIQERRLLGNNTRMEIASQQSLTGIWSLASLRYQSLRCCEQRPVAVFLALYDDRKGWRLPCPGLLLALSLPLLLLALY